ncbi:type II toxin-antitoxin system antitoxin SocA domain-containing protein [Novosphingobium sp. RD2P27]|uniref:Type II toxin-antitoxin system antitoxin SocA domain-containing protein n=1 Tax=Novosphingobium kalidii TaxID=3230299 RepID=A0ABV2CZ85_9SPHN
MYAVVRELSDAKSPTPYEIKGLANLLLDWSDQEKIQVTPMKLQKMLYFCHADYLCTFKRPLIRQQFEAWDFGPVEPSVFAEFRESSKSPIVGRAMQFSPTLGRRILATIDLNPDDLEILRPFFDFYKHSSATKLSDMSHDRTGPWFAARRLFDEGRNADRRISDQLISSFHSKAKLS